MDTSEGQGQTDSLPFLRSLILREISGYLHKEMLGSTIYVTTSPGCESSSDVLFGSIPSCVFCRVQMANISSFQTTSFHTELSFLDGDTDDDLLENEEEEEDEEESYVPSGTSAVVCVWCVFMSV